MPKDLSITVIVAAWFPSSPSLAKYPEWLIPGVSANADFANDRLLLFDPWWIIHERLLKMSELDAPQALPDWHAAA